MACRKLVFIGDDQFLLVIQPNRIPLPKVACRFGVMEGDPVHSALFKLPNENALPTEVYPYFVGRVNRAPLPVPACCD